MAGSISKRVTKSGDRYVVQLPPSMGRISKSFDTYEKAAAWLEGQQPTTQVPTEPDSPSEGLLEPSVGALLGLWLSAGMFKEATLTDYTYRIGKYVSPSIGGLTSLLPTDIDGLLLRLPANHQRIRIGKILSAFCAWAYANQYLSIDAYRLSQAKRILRLTERSLSPREQTEQVWTAQEVSAFIEAEPNDTYRCLWAFIAVTGSRRGEALGLRRECLSLDSGYVWLAENVTQAAGKVCISETPKSWTKRKAFVGPMVGKLLESLPTSSPYLFSRKGTHLIPECVTVRFNRQTKKMGLPLIGGPHGLRRTFATLADIEGFRPRVTQTALGHTPSLSESYSKVSDSELQALATHIERLILP